MNLLEGFFKFIKTHQLPINGDQTTLLAVSGGLDSIVMAHLFHQAGFPFAVAHCNFQLRGSESDGDELFVEKVALSYGVPFFIKRFETKTYAENEGVSTQMAARNLRYEWFSEILEENGFSGIATAHHLNDSVETTMLNFARGTGLPGLSGIAPKSGQRYRPLLFATRNDILAYAQARKLDWREDSSNETDDYIRNYLRRHIIPRMEDLNLNFLRTAERNMERIGEAEKNLHFLLHQWLGLNPSTQHQTLHNIHPLSIDKQALTQLPSVHQALRHLLKPYGFDAEQARQLAENLDQTGLELTSHLDWQLLNDRDKIFLKSLRAPVDAPVSTMDTLPSTQVNQDDLMVSLPDGSRLFLMPFEGHPSAITLEQTDSALVDIVKLEFPLHLRRWQAGDSFQPLGMGGKSQKLQDFFTNQKLSRFDKEKVWLLCNADGAIIWVLGMRLDERFKIHLNTNKALKFNWIK